MPCTVYYSPRGIKQDHITSITKALPALLTVDNFKFRVNLIKPVPQYAALFCTFNT
jgi:hypothetical protein